MFVDKTEGNDKSCHSSAYPEMTGNKGTHHVNFLSPIGEGWANTLTVESQVHPEVKGHGNNERHYWHEQQTYRPSDEPRGNPEEQGQAYMLVENPHENFKRKM